MKKTGEEVILTVGFILILWGILKVFLHGVFVSLHLWPQYAQYDKIIPLSLAIIIVAIIKKTISPKLH